MLFGASFALAADRDPADADPFPLSSTSAAPTGEEIPALRTATSATFELPSGERQVEIFESPINFKEDGKWRRIDTGLEEAPGAGLTNGQNSFDLRLPEAMGEGPIRFAEDEQWVSSRLLGQTAGIEEVEGATATYETAGGAVAFDLTSTTAGVKEEIVLDDYSAPSSFTFELKASSGLTPELAADGSVRFNDKMGETFALLPAPTIADSSATTPGLPGEHVAYALTQGDGGSWRLAVTADREWLEDPARVWPVTIDPTIVAPYSGNDCVLYDAGLQNYNLCASSGWPQLVGVAWHATSGDQIGRSIMNFNLSSIPPKASVFDASLNLYSPSKAQNSSGVQVRRLTSAWGNTATWNCGYYSFGCVKWTKPGGDFTEEGSEVLTSERGNEPGPWIFKGLGPVVEGWLSGSTLPAGLLLKLKDESPRVCCISRTIEFASSAAANPAQRPSLTVSYYPAAPATSKVISPTDGTRTAKRLKLQATWESGVTGVTWQYREGKAGLFKTIPPELVRDGKGEAVKSWPVGGFKITTSDPLYLDAAGLSPTLRKKGGPVQIRALFEGGAGGLVSAPVESKLDPALGGPKDALAPVGPGTVNLLTGNLTVTKTDVSIPTFNSSLDFSRTFNSRDAGKTGDKGVLGQGWKPGVPVEENGAGEWGSVKLNKESETIEGVTYEFAWAEVIGIDGEKIPFEKEEGGTNYITPDDLPGWTLTAPSANQFALSTPDGTKTTFDNKESPDPSSYLPVEVSQTSSGNKTRMTYEVKEGNRRLKQITAPSFGTLDCVTNPKETAGCKVLTFTYMTAAFWGAPAAYGERLGAIQYAAPGFGSWQVASYSYNASGRLNGVWDPRISPTLKEEYTYESTGQIKTITPPGLKPWTMEYGTLNEEEASGRLMAVKRDSLVEGTPVAQTTIAYGVPLSGSSLPSMTGTDVAKWGQTDVPVDATAILPPDSEPSSYSRASIFYMDSDGYSVNTATPAVPGASEPSISTTETDKYGNVVRELTPQNRVRALEAGAGSKTRSEELETFRQYGKDGTEMVQEIGPLHDVRLEETGAVVPARSYTYFEYDQGYTPGSAPAPHLPTTEKTAAMLEGGALKDIRTNKTEYNWFLRKPIKQIIDAGEGGLKLTTTQLWNNQSGQLIQKSQPSNEGGGGPGSTVFSYFNEVLGGPCGVPKYAGLTCAITPAQRITSSNPKVLETMILAYNPYGQPTEVTERPGGEGAIRKTLTTYDSAGRALTTKIENGGTAVPMTKTEYSSTTGLPTTQRFTCVPACEDDQALTTAYDALGRPTEYKDADGNTSKTTYDLLGRPITTNDGKGTQTRTYDPTSGLLTKLEDSAAGTFTASFDADGNMVAEGLPNGLVAESIYDEAGQVTDLSYNKTACSEECLWLDFDADRSINGQILNQKSLSSRQEYSYDKAGRLIQTNDWDAPEGGICTTRQYKFDGGTEAENLAGKNSNRLKMVTRSSGLPGACATSGGSETKYSYDAADRLIGEGITYDDFGRITSLPGVWAGFNKALTTSYFSTDMVASQMQDGVTNTFQLDASLRQRQRTQGGGLEGVEVFHYAGGSDTPAWTQLGTKWSRNIGGIGGGVSAIQDSSSETLLQLTNLHGDVVAAATLSPSATKPVATFEHDEFGVPKLGAAQQFGWLGSKGRRTEFASGVIQMGARSYVPTLGRFLTPDPVFGGSANAYEYAGQDPVNGLDLTGTVCQKKNKNSTKGSCHNKQGRGERGVRNVINHLRERLKNARERRTKRIVGMYPSESPSVMTPVEKEVTTAISMGVELLAELDAATSCDAGEAVALNGNAYYGYKAVNAATRVARIAAARMAANFALIGAALTTADLLGFC
jgi:RHS repeat-associated protein